MPRVGSSAMHFGVAVAHDNEAAARLMLDRAAVDRVVSARVLN